MKRKKLAQKNKEHQIEETEAQERKQHLEEQKCLKNQPKSPNKNNKNPAVIAKQH